MKQCNKCNEIKSLSAYTPDVRNKDGLQGICKDCRRTVKREARRRAEFIGPTKSVMEKQCNKCKVVKSIKEFYKDTGIADGHATICKKCKSENVASWREAHRDQYNATMRNYNHNNYQRLRLNRYKLTPEEHANMLAAQKGLCAICENPPKGKRPLAVDHRHSDGKVRGLLCYGCNRALHVLESLDLLERAKAYLRKYE